MTEATCPANGPNRRTERGNESRQKKKPRREKGSQGGKHARAAENGTESGKGSARATPTNSANKGTIRGQQVQLGRHFERGNTRGLLHL